MLEHPKDLGTYSNVIPFLRVLILQVTILNIIQWAISREPNHAASMTVGPSETTREAHGVTFYTIEMI
jgi:hypothetical protein